MLNEEALSASSAHTRACGPVTPDEPAEGAPRYSEAAGVEHHPQVTDFLPRRYRTIGAAGGRGRGDDGGGRGAVLVCRAARGDVWLRECGGVRSVGRGRARGVAVGRRA